MGRVEEKGICHNPHVLAGHQPVPLIAAMDSLLGSTQPMREESH